MQSRPGDQQTCQSGKASSVLAGLCSTSPTWQTQIHIMQRCLLKLTSTAESTSAGVIAGGGNQHGNGPLHPAPMQLITQPPPSFAPATTDRLTCSLRTSSTSRDTMRSMCDLCELCDSKSSTRREITSLLRPLADPPRTPLLSFTATPLAICCLRWCSLRSSSAGRQGGRM